jgi:hypothetical protein
MLVATRAAASPDGRQPDARDAVRYADALTGCESRDDDDDQRDSDDDPDDALDGDERGCVSSVDAIAREPSAAIDHDPSVDRDATGPDRDAAAGNEPVDTDDVRWVGDPSLDELEAEELALIDDEPDEDAIRTGVAFASATFDDAAAMRDLGERHHRPSRWGRLDLTVAWRRAWSVARTDERSDALWLYATWRR